MLRRFPSVLAQVGAVLLASCTLADTDDAATGELSAAAICFPCTAPPIVDWAAGRAGPRDLFPPSVTHLHTLMTQGDSVRTVYAWGIGDGQPIWVFRVQKSALSSFTGALANAWMVMEEPGGKSHSIAGSVSSPPPRHPPAPGVPWFSRSYLEEVHAAATHHEVETGALLDQLGGM